MSTSDVVYLVRHAKAGERRVWTGDDVARPLSRQGWKQAHAVSERLAGKGVSTIHSSPYVRCVQTVEPLAELIGTEITIDDRLAEDSPFEPVLDLLAQVDRFGGVVQPRRRHPRNDRGTRAPGDGGAVERRLAQGHRLGAPAQGRPDHQGQGLAPALLTRAVCRGQVRIGRVSRRRRGSGRRSSTRASRPPLGGCSLRTSRCTATQPRRRRGTGTR